MKGLIYNITFKVELSIADEFFKWMAEEHLIEILKTGMFDSVRLTRVRLDENDGETFAYQFTTPSEQYLEKYLREDAAKFEEIVGKRFANKFVFFTSILELVDEYNVKFT